MLGDVEWGTVKCLGSTGVTKTRTTFVVYELRIHENVVEDGEVLLLSIRHTAVENVSFGGFLGIFLCSC